MISSISSVFFDVVRFVLRIFNCSWYLEIHFQIFLDCKIRLKVAKKYTEFWFVPGRANENYLALVMWAEAIGYIIRLH